MKIDFHIHTTASDGQYTPGEIVQMCKEKGISYFAVTDHDTVSGLSEAEQKAKELDMAFVPGIEISTQDGEEIHMLGYFIDYNNEQLVKACNEYEASRMQRGERIAAFFQRRNLPLDLEEVREYAGSGSMGRPHFARWLMEHGYVSDRKEAFRKYLDTEDFHKETDRVKPTPTKAIELIHVAGGKAVLAHPGLLKMSLDAQERLIDSLKQAGLDGLECFYGKHSSDQAMRYANIAKKLDLFTTFGSDFHGERVKPNVSLGMEADFSDDSLRTIFDCS